MNHVPVIASLRGHTISAPFIRQGECTHPAEHGEESCDADWGSEMKRQIVMFTFALAAVVAPSGGPTVAEARARQVDAGESQVQANGITIAYSTGSTDRRSRTTMADMRGDDRESDAVFSYVSAE